VSKIIGRVIRSSPIIASTGNLKAEPTRIHPHDTRRRGIIPARRIRSSIYSDR
jgi:hypothetical protein